MVKTDNIFVMLQIQDSSDRDKFSYLREYLMSVESLDSVRWFCC